MQGKESRTIFVAAALGVAVVLVVSVVLFVGERRVASVATPDPALLARPQVEHGRDLAEIDELKARLSALESALRERGAASEGAGGLTPEIETVDEPRTPVQAAAARDEGFWSQPPRSAWGVHAESELAHIRNDPAVQSVSCRATSCRIEAHHQSRESSAAFVEKVAEDPALFGHQIDYYRTDDEGLEQIIYVNEPRAEK